MFCIFYDGDVIKVVFKLDMLCVIVYGKEKGVGVWVYVNQYVLMKQMCEFFLLLYKWGVVGVKFGFVQYVSYCWVIWLYDMVCLVVENKLLINIYDEFCLFGFSCIYFNLFIQEGIWGNEEFFDVMYNMILFFICMINGVVDYIICYFDKCLKNIYVYQLVVLLIFYSFL